MTIQQLVEPGDRELVAPTSGYGHRLLSCTALPQPARQRLAHNLGDDAGAGHRTTAQMGSGHFPREGLTRSVLVSRIGSVDRSGTVKKPGHTRSHTVHNKTELLQRAVGETKSELRNSFLLRRSWIFEAVPSSHRQMRHRWRRKSYMQPHHHILTSKINIFLGFFLLDVIKNS